MKLINNMIEIVLLLFLISIPIIYCQPCPNICNSHGFCQANSTCTCLYPYMGPDCSMMQCPYDNAWVDKADVNKVAHRPAECSNRGLCDRQSGICNCFPGFEGTACEKMSCPCVNGQCMTIGNIYDIYTIN